MTAHDQVATADSIAGSDLVIRLFRDTSDYEHMVRIDTACRDVDHLDWHMTAEEIERFFTSQPHLDPIHDAYFAEVGEDTVGYGFTFMSTDAEGLQRHRFIWFVVPAWRQRGIGRTLLHVCEARARERAAVARTDGPQYFEAWLNEEQEGKRALLQREGYEAIRHYFSMLRPLDVAIPERSLPEGLEVREIEAAHHPHILDAFNEAFLDHWSHVPFTEEQYQARWLDDPEADTDLWRIAWDGDDIAGVCINSISAGENATFDRKRGWIHVVGVRRPWRKRGLATALLADSLWAFEARGMEEVGLGVDSENPTGALRLYEKIGFRVHRRGTMYRKPFP